MEPVATSTTTTTTTTNKSIVETANEAARAVKAEVDETHKSLGMRCVRVITIIVAVVSLSFGIYTFFRNRKLEEEKREQTMLFMEASQRFTKELDDQEHALRATTAKMGEQTQLLQRMSEKLNDTHRYLVEEHKAMTRSHLDRLERRLGIDGTSANSSSTGDGIGNDRGAPGGTVALQWIWQ